MCILHLCHSFFSLADGLLQRKGRAPGTGNHRHRLPYGDPHFGRQGRPFVEEVRLSERVSKLSFAYPFLCWLGTNRLAASRLWISFCPPVTLLGLIDK